MDLSKEKLAKVRKVGFIGDVHGCWDDLHFAMKKLSEIGCDIAIQVGDFGFFPHYLQNFSKGVDQLPLCFIDGNHEHFELLESMADPNSNSPCRIDDLDVFYLPRGVNLVIGGRTFAFLGGGVSIDREMRVPNVSWFAREVPNYAEWSKAYAIKEPVDVFVTHDAPEYALLKHQLLPHEDSLLNRLKLDDLSKALNPKAWVHGHYHFPVRSLERGCDLRGLACAPDVVVYDCELGSFID